MELKETNDKSVSLPASHMDICKEPLGTAFKCTGLALAL